MDRRLQASRHSRRYLPDDLIEFIAVQKEDLHYTLLQLAE